MLAELLKGQSAPVMLCFSMLFRLDMLRSLSTLALEPPCSKHQPKVTTTPRYATLHRKVMLALSLPCYWNYVLLDQLASGVYVLVAVLTQVPVRCVQTHNIAPHLEDSFACFSIKSPVMIAHENMSFLWVLPVASGPDSFILIHCEHVTSL